MQKSTSIWHRHIFWNIRVWELAAFAGLHVALALLYFGAIWLTSSQLLTQGIAINHVYKVVLTAPFWWLFFRKLRHWPLSKKLLLHLPACALHVSTWLFLYYQTADWLKFGRLSGTGVWWDVYIPTLIYFIQFGIFHAYDYWQETIRQQQKEKALLKLAHTAELNTLKAQIQPHFLFNTLNSISASVPAAQEHTRTLIAQLADVFRFAMQVTDKEAIPLDKELAFIQNFLALEQQRFGDRLAVTYDITQQASRYTIAPMLLQPLVENAVKHGIAKSLDGGAIHIRVQPVEGQLCFEIADTGNGINGYAPGQLFSKGIGLENTRQRLQRLYDTDLQIRPVHPRGTSVSFALPLQPLTPDPWN